MLISSGFTAAVDLERCLECEACVDACPFNALTFVNGDLQVDTSRCMGCGICEGVCENEALRLVRDPDKPAPLLLEELLEADP